MHLFLATNIPPPPPHPHPREEHLTWAIAPNKNRVMCSLKFAVCHRRYVVSLYMLFLCSWTADCGTRVWPNSLHNALCLQIPLNSYFDLVSTVTGPWRIALGGKWGETVCFTHTLIFGCVYPGITYPHSSHPCTGFIILVGYIFYSGWELIGLFLVKNK